ncbi:helix-turn-helix domain-containing protein [Streptomyces sp. NPDC046900]|uniref:helix-turn-helix domain-containing protein n=1 Tax=Streptomyces sp. NPDC046900 TaxID=3155473 RepID=UPI0033F44E65
MSGIEDPPPKAGPPPRAAIEIDAVLDLIDELTECDADLESLLARTASALDCAVGIRTARGEVCMATPRGIDRTGQQPPHAGTHDLPGTGRVWIDAPGLARAGPRAALLLRRLGIAAKVALLGHAPPATDSVALRSVVDIGLEMSTRSRMLLRLGLKETSATTVFALCAPADPARMFVEQVRQHARGVLDAPAGNLHLVLANDLDPTAVLGVPPGTRAAFAGPYPASQAPEAWRLARLALRFARPSPRAQGPYTVEEAVLVDGAQLGGYAVLAETLSDERIALVPDVHRLNRLVDEHGEDMLVCLEAVAATESVRKAARLLHRHHNSVAYRVERAERYLGFSFTEPYGRPRLFLALVLRRLQDSGHLFPMNGTDGAPSAPSVQ